MFEGNVSLTQGTLQIKADKIMVKQDADGFKYGIAYGNPAYFRQKRDGFDEYIEGYGERIEYDGKADKMQMFTNARDQARQRRGARRLHFLRRNHRVLPGHRRRQDGGHAGQSAGPGPRRDPAQAQDPPTQPGAASSVELAAVRRACSLSQR